MDRSSDRSEVIRNGYPTIVLVHGAFADASGFRGLYDELLGEDVTVLAPPNPLRGLSGGEVSTSRP